MNEVKKSSIKYAFNTSLPVLAGYLVLGFGFGVLLQSNGYAWWWTFIMSVTMFSGSLQYMGVGLLASQESILTTALISLAVNIRHLFYGITMLKRYKNADKKFRPYIIFAMTDETFSLVSTKEIPQGVDESRFFFYLSLFNHLYWISGCALGGIIGTAIPFNNKGIDFAMTALFVVIFVEQWEKTKNHLPALTGVIASVICLLVFGKEFIIPAMILITICLFAERPYLDKEEADDDE